MDETRALRLMNGQCVLQEQFEHLIRASACANRLR